MSEFEAELRSPFRDGLKRDLNAALGQQIFDVSKAEWKPVIEPDRIGDDLGGKTVASEMSRRDFGHCHQYQAVHHRDVNPTLPVRFYGTIPNTPEAIRRLVDRLRAGGDLHFCYEAGGCGYGIYRQLLQMGTSCMVIAPSMMPKKPGDRIKNDRRDAVTLARLLRAGELTAIWVPDEDHEAVRDLVRARRQAKGDLVAARQMLLGFLLRQGRRFPGRTNWTRMHWRWLGEQAFASPHQQFVFGECVRRIEEAQTRCDRLDSALQEAMGNWSLAPFVKALQALRGLALSWRRHW